jgi:hypothetical protein
VALQGLVNRIAARFVNDLNLDIETVVFSGSAAVGQSNGAGLTADDFNGGPLQFLPIISYDFIKPAARIFKYWFSVHLLLLQVFKTWSYGPGR